MKPIIKKVPCNCACHNPDVDLIHMMPCCYNGFKEVVDKDYYTPDKEDIRVGYECEWLGSDGLSHRYFPLKMSEITITNAVQQGIQFYRTPYLTKEQIEAEGWQHIGGQMVSVSKQLFEKIVGTRGFCELEYTKLNQKLKINQRNHIRDGSGRYILLPIYDGYCPSINEFRQITKLLNI